MLGYAPQDVFGNNGQDRDRQLGFGGCKKFSVLSEVKVHVEQGLQLLITGHVLLGQLLKVQSIN
jgi:hypothetical protein